MGPICTVIMKIKRITIAIHALVWILLLVIPYASTDQIFNALDPSSDKDYLLLCLSLSAVLIITFYFNYFFLIPRYLLKTDHIYLYTPARVDPNVPVEDTIGALADLVQKGVIRFIGLSEAAPVTIRKAAAVHPITALQIEYSLWSRDIEAEVLPTIRELGIGLVAYSPLSRGFLSGEIRTPDDLKDNRVHMPRFQGENFYKNLELVEKIKALATEKNCTPSQLALAWVLARGENIIVIPGTKRIAYLEENIAAENVQLTQHDLESIDAIMPAGIVSGTRYPEMFMQLLNR